MVIDFPFQPPSGGCVLKPDFVKRLNAKNNQPPSGGCVLKPLAVWALIGIFASRLQAAVC